MNTKIGIEEKTYFNPNGEPAHTFVRFQLPYPGWLKFSNSRYWKTAEKYLERIQREYNPTLSKDLEYQSETSGYNENLH